METFLGRRMSTYMTLNTFDKRGVSPNQKERKKTMMKIRDIASRAVKGIRKRNETR